MYFCDPCKFEGKWKSHYEAHIRTLKHYTNTNQYVEPNYKYECKKCNFKTTCNSKLNKHKQTLKHKELMNPPELKICSMCNYRTYRMECFQKHLKRHKTNQDSLTYVKIKLNEPPEIKEHMPEQLLTKDEAKDKINDLLKIFIEKGIDPNKYINYKYYALNIDNLSLIELNDFYKELDSIME
jgi:hypothetical protein